MIFSFSKGFIFFGLPKSGSTSLHYLLSRYGELVFSRVENGKHETCENTLRNCTDFFELYPFQKYLKFGVIREPASLVHSWYRVWSNPALANPAHPAHNRWLNGKSIGEFVDILEAEKLFNGPEQFYRMADGSLGVDYLIRLDRIKEDTAALEAVLPIKISDKLAATRFNPSYKGPAKSSATKLDPAMKQRIRDVFAEDMDLYESVDAINTRFLNSAWQCPDLTGAEKLFKTLYPKLYGTSAFDKRYNALKRLMPEKGLLLIQNIKKIFNNR
jgi:hypothetical protein